MFSFFRNFWTWLLPNNWHIEGVKFIRASNEIVRMCLSLLTKTQVLGCDVWAFKWNAVRDYDCCKPDFMARVIKGELLKVCERIPVNPNNSIIIVIGDYRRVFHDKQQRCIVFKPKERCKPILLVGSKDSLYQALDKIPELSGFKNIIETYSEYIEEA